MLNNYFTAIAEPILNNNGFVDKYIGDGILAAFGIRGESAESACKNAVRAAFLMQEAVQRLRPGFEQSFHISLEAGIGIHFGSVILGRLGHPGKRQITVIGDTVNIASRIESSTKNLNVPILVSESLVKILPGTLRVGSPSEVQLKGKAQSLLLYPCDGFAEEDSVFLVQKTFERISGRSFEFGDRFYALLFEEYPDMRGLFQRDLEGQKKMLVSMLGSLVRGLNRMEEISGGLHELGKRHREYKVAPTDYDKVARVLIKTLEEFLGDDFTLEIRKAWTTIYGRIASSMIEAQNGDYL
jgi:hemoglobin-like flavoprotein